MDEIQEEAGDRQWFTHIDTEQKVHEEIEDFNDGVDEINETLFGQEVN